MQPYDSSLYSSSRYSSHPSSSEQQANNTANSHQQQVNTFNQQPTHQQGASQNSAPHFTPLHFPYPPLNVQPFMTTATQAMEVENTNALPEMANNLKKICENPKMIADLFEIGGIPEDKDYICLFAKKAGKELKHLDLSGLELTEIEIIKIIDACPNLQSLNLDGEFENPSTVSDEVLEYIQSLSSLQSLSLGFCEDITDNGLEYLKTLPLHSLSLKNCYNITEKGLKHLQSITSLQFLDLSGCENSNEGLKYLKALTLLQVLNLGIGEIHDDTEGFDDAGLKHLQSMTSLRVLSVADHNITDNGLKYLKTLPLESLNLSGTKITNQGLTHLQSMTTLRSLNLTLCKNISDVGLKYLQSLTSLNDLNLNDNDISDTGLENLKPLISLQDLSLRNSKITDSGLTHLLSFFSLKFLDVLGCGFWIIGHLFRTSLKNLQVKCDNQVGPLEILYGLHPLQDKEKKKE